MKKINNKKFQDKFMLDTFKGICQFKKIEVWWLDAQHSTNIIYLEELKELKPLLTKNIGYLLKNCNEYIIIGYMLFDNENIKHWQLIPKPMIIKIKELK